VPAAGAAARVASASQLAAPGSVSCSYSAKVRSTPALTEAGGGGIEPSSIRSTLTGCTTSDGAVQIRKASFKGFFSRSPLDCAFEGTTGAVLTGTVSWKGTFDGRTARFVSSSLGDGTSTGSFAGVSALSVTLPTDYDFPHACSKGGGDKVAPVTGLMVFGGACQNGGPVSMCPIDPEGACGSDTTPYDITSGPDGALWFTLTKGASDQFPGCIGRMSSSGVETYYTGAGIQEPRDITTGPDGALWFVNTWNNTIGRITTSGVVTDFALPGDVGANDITAGPDGALWFTSGTSAGTGAPYGEIGRITTAGGVTLYGDATIDDPTQIVAGSDGALWFTNTGHWEGTGASMFLGGQSIGRITTSGVVSSFTGPDLADPSGLAAAPDGAMWFTGLHFGQITSSGAVTLYGSPYVEDPVSVASDSTGALWFLNYAAPPSVGRITTSGAVTDYYQTSVAPWDIALGSQGSVWFTEELNDVIGRIASP
jgi:virginiamycin B lyase